LAAKGFFFVGLNRTRKSHNAEERKNSWFYLGAPLLLCSFTLLGAVGSSLNWCAKGGLGSALSFRPSSSSLFFSSFSLLHTRYERREEWW